MGGAKAWLETKDSTFVLIVSSSEVEVDMEAMECLFDFVLDLDLAEAERR